MIDLFLIGYMYISLTFRFTLATCKLSRFHSNLEDKIVDGEDFQLNRWRCLETPDRASLGPVGGFAAWWFSLDIQTLRRYLEPGPQEVSGCSGFG